MATQTKTVIDLAKDTVVIEDFTAEDIQNQKDIADAENEAIDAKKQTEIDKAALLVKLGITADEAKLLLN